MPLNDTEFSEYESLSSLKSLNDLQMGRLEALDNQSKIQESPKESFLQRLGQFAAPRIQQAAKTFEKIERPIIGSPTFGPLYSAAKESAGTVLGPLISEEFAGKLAEKTGRRFPESRTAQIGAAALGTLGQILSPADLLLPVVNKLRLLAKAPQAVRMAELANIQAKVEPKVFKAAIEALGPEDRIAFTPPQGTGKLAALDIQQSGRQAAEKRIKELTQSVSGKTAEVKKIENELMTLSREHNAIRNKNAFPSAPGTLGEAAKSGIQTKADEIRKTIIARQNLRNNIRADINKSNFELAGLQGSLNRPLPELGKPFTLQAGLAEQNRAALEAFRAKLPQGPATAPRIAQEAALGPKPAVVPTPPIIPPATPKMPPVLPKTGGVYTGKPNLAIMGDEPAIKVTQDLMDEFGSLYEQSKGGVISNAELLGRAQNLGLSPEDVIKFRASPNESAKVLAARLIREKATKDLSRNIGSVDINNPEQLQEIGKQIARTVQIDRGARAIASEKGRSLQALKVKLTTVETLEQKALELAESKAFLSEPDKLKSIVKRLQSLGQMTPEQLADELRKARPFSQKLMEYVQTNSLMSPITWLWNTVSGPVGLGAQLNVRALATLGGLPERLAGKSVPKFGEVPIMAAGQIEGMYEGILKVFGNLKNTLAKGSGGGEEVLGALPGFYGKAARGLSYGPLQAADTIFETAAGRGAAWAKAYRKATDMGGDLKTIIANVKNLVNNDPEILLEAKRAAQEWSYKLPFGEEAKRLAETGIKEKGMIPNLAYKWVERMGEYGKTVSATRAKYPEVGAFFLRFLVTPVNIAKLNAQIGPAAILSPRNIASLMASPEMRADAIGRVALGGALSYAIGQGILSGRITTGWARTAAGRRLQKEQGFKPNSVVIKGQYYPLTMFPIIGGNAVLIGDAFDAYRNNDKAADPMFEAALYSGVRSTLSQPYLQGVQDLLSAVQYGEIGTKGQAFAAGAAQSLIPAFSALGFAARNIDPTIREAKTVRERVQSGIPFLSKSLPAKLGAFGQEQKRNYKWGLILRSEKVDDPAVNYLVQLDIPVPDYPDSLYGVKLSDAQRRKIQTEAGQRIKRALDFYIGNPVGRKILEKRKEGPKKALEDLIQEQKDISINAIVPGYKKAMESNNTQAEKKAWVQSWVKANNE